MGADIINLKRARKLRAREAKEETAAQNRVQFGRTKAERALVTAQQTREALVLDGAKRVPSAANRGASGPPANHDDAHIGDTLPDHGVHGDNAPGDDVLDPGQAS